MPALLSSKLVFSADRNGYGLSLALGCITSLLTAAAYIVFTSKLETGRYSTPDLLLFAVLNGLLEQLMFICAFLLGCWLARLARGKGFAVFAAGFITFAMYSGPIHAIFWYRVLPPHIPATAPMQVVLTTMSFLWMWLFWRYRAVGAIIAMHIVIDFLMIGHLNLHWFEQIAG